MQQLSADTVRLLSSSQVITSVLNVVKELMENSLDAGATCVNVTLENYGLDRVEVRDNGRGIQVQDTAVMAVRHYTSKICCHDDLERLDTYGFRGEALGSICAVAEVCVTTKTQDDDISTQYSLDLAGKVLSQKPSHLGQGTSVCVLKLFQKLPVRRQYYANAKKCREELKKVQDLLMAYGIMRPELRLTLTHNKVVAWQKARVSDHRSALLVTLGSGAVANLVPCHHQQLNPQISLEGFFPKPGADIISSSSTSPDRTFLFINTRPVHNKDIMKLVRQRYLAQYAQQGAATTGRYPAPLVLMVTVPPCSLDVNLTPDKTQVLLHNKEAVLTAVEAMLVSLYGYRSAEAEPPDASSSSAEHNRSPETEAEPPAATSSSAEHNRRSSEDGEHFSHDAPHHLPLSTDNSVLHRGPRSGQRDSVAREEVSVPSPRSDSVPSPCSDSVPKSGGPRSEQRDSVSVLSVAPHTAANSSSSSSVSEDWIVNAFDDSLLNPCSNDGADTTAAADHPECSWSANRLADDDDAWVQNHPTPPEAPGEQRQPSAETWSAGTALSDPASGKPLQPVRVHRPVSANQHDMTVITTTELAASLEVEGQRPEVGPDRKTPNMVTEKRGSLTAYHLISQRATRAALSPQGLFDREARACILADTPSASPLEVVAEVGRRWESLDDAERHKYEKKAKQQQEQQRNKLLSPGGQGDPRGQRRGVASQGAKRKAPSNHQQLLDELFNAGSAPKKTRKLSADAKPCRPLPFNMVDLRLRLGHLQSPQSAAGAATGGPGNPPPRGGLRLVERLCAVSQSAWLLLRGGRSLALVNPCRVEEALLFQRLLEENVLPAVSLPHPVTLTDSVLGGAELWRALCAMQKSDRRDADGRRSFCDPRLVANGFTVMECPADGHLEVTAMADCVPFVGLEDLREILSIVQRSGSAAQGVLRDCRPLKVANYLQGEAVRLARQLPAHPSRDDVKAIVLRMERQLGVDDGVVTTTCIHGRPLLQPLCDVPEDDSQALALLSQLTPLSL